MIVIGVIGVVLVVGLILYGLVFWCHRRRDTSGATWGSLPSDNTGAVELRQVFTLLLVPGDGEVDGAGGTGEGVLPSQQA